MKRGKKICGELKKIRRRIADENGIKLDIPECTYEGDCRGTCPRCEWEVKYLEKTLFERLKLGKIATISGLALGLSACGGGGVGPDIQLVDELPNKDTQNVMSEIVPPPPPPELPAVLGELPIAGDVICISDTNPSSNAPASAIKQEDSISEEEDVEYFYMVGAVVETMPEFPGGEQALYEFLAKNMRYPQAAKDDDLQGEVFVQFVVEKDGTITNPKVMQDIGGGCGEEALRVVSMMPKWKPGSQRGKTVRMNFTLPFIFQLEE